MQGKIQPAFEKRAHRVKSSRRLTGELKQRRNGEQLTCMDKSGEQVQERMGTSKRQRKEAEKRKKLVQP